MMLDSWTALTNSSRVTPAVCSRARLGTMWNSGTWPPCTSTVLTPFDAVERRLQIVGGDLPQAGLRNRVFAAIVRGERVAEDGKGREGETVGGDVRRGGERLGNPGEGRVRQLQGAKHIHIPVEEEADFRRAAAGGAAHGQQAGNAVDGVFNRLGDGDLHLFDGHDAVVHANDHAGKVGLGKNGDGHLKRRVDAGKR